MNQDATPVPLAEPSLDAPKLNTHALKRTPRDVPLIAAVWHYLRRLTLALPAMPVRNANEGVDPQQW